MMEIDRILRVALKGSDRCHTCGKVKLSDAFLCIKCGLWQCNGCEVGEECICIPCSKRERIEILK